MSGIIASYTTKSDLAYVLIRNKILTHAYSPGSTLNQATMAQDLGVSTTPLREAMRRLNAEGLVELDAHRDAHVTELSVGEADDLLELRMALDPMAVALAAERCVATDIVRIRQAARVHSLPDEPGAVDLVAHRDFHRAIYLASHNTLLIASLDGLWDKADRYRVLGLKDPRDLPERNQKADEHHQLMELVLAGDGAGAAAVMREHIQTSLGAKAARLLSCDDSVDADGFG